MTNRNTHRQVRALGRAQRDPLQVRQATVMAVTHAADGTQTVDLQIGGSTTTIPGVPYMFGAMPVVTESVFMFSDGKDLYAWGAFQGPQATAVTGGVGFSAGWADTGGAFQPVGYFKDASGLVHIHGITTASATATAPKTIFTLPAGWRPAAGHQHVFTCQATGQVPARVDVLSTGVVQLNSPTLASGNFLSLESIVFIAEQ